MDVSIKLPRKGMLLINSLNLQSRKQKHDNTKEMTEKLLNSKKIKLGNNWLKEIDSIP